MAVRSQFMWAGFNIMGVSVVMSLFLLASISGALVLSAKVPDVYKVFENIRPTAFITTIAVTYSLAVSIPIYAPGGLNIYVVFSICILLITLPSYITLSTVKVDDEYVINRSVYATAIIASLVLMSIGVYTESMREGVPDVIFFITVIFALMTPALLHRGFVEILHVVLYNEENN
jgi:hypothetical protein